MLNPRRGTKELISRAPALPYESFEEKRPTVNKEEPRMDTINTNTDGPPSTTSGAEMLLQFCALGVTMSWDDGFPGARASRPHKAWHSLGHLSHLDQPGMAPWLSYGLAAAVPADRVAACSIALKLSGDQRNRMRAGRPRSQAMPSRRCGGGCLAGDFSESRRAPFGKLPFAREPGSRPRLHAGAASPLYKGRPVGDASSGEPRQPGLRR